MKLWKEGPYYHFRFQVGGVRIQRSTGTGNKAEAQDIAMAAWREAKDRKRGVEPIPTLAQARQKWLETHAQTVSLGHWRNIQRLDLQGMDEVPVDRLTTDLVQVARNRVLEGRSPATANGWLRSINLVVSSALGSIPYSVKMLKVQRKPRPTLPASKVLAYLGAIDSGRFSPQVGTAVRMMIGLGLREGEVLSARWEWLDWDRKIYTVGKAKGKEARAIPVPDWLLDHLREIPHTIGLILPNQDGKPHADDFTRRALAAANKAVGVAGVSPHRLRGTFATMHSENGTPLQVIQAMLGHKDIQTTMAYVEAHLEAARTGQDRVAELMGLGGGKMA